MSSFLQKAARFKASVPYLTEAEKAACWNQFSETEKVAFTAMLNAAKPMLGRIGGAIGNTGKKVGQGLANMATGGGGKNPPGFLGKAWNVGSQGLALAGAGTAAWNAMNPQPKLGSLTKQALSMGLHDAIDLGAYGLLAAGPVAETVAPEWAHEHFKQLTLSDIAGLGILARHHIPGLAPNHT